LPYQHSSDPGEEFSKLLHDTGFEVIDCKCRDGEFTYDTLSSLRGDCGIHKFNFKKNKTSSVNDCTVEDVELLTSPTEC